MFYAIDKKSTCVFNNKFIMQSYTFTHNYTLKPMDIIYVDVMTGYICRQFRLLIHYSFIGQYFPVEGGDGIW